MPRCAQVVLERGPHRHLVARLGLGAAGRLVHRVHRRHPHDARSLARGDLDGECVHPTDGPVEGDRAQHRDPGDDAPHDRGALRRRRVVRLEDEPGQPELLEPSRERDVVDPPLDDVGRDVDVHVEGAADEISRAC